MNSNKVYIKGITEEGGRFRPSDWNQRISSHFATYHLKTLRFNPKILPGTLDGVACLVIDKTLETKDAEAWEYLMHFAQMNKLMIIDGVDEA